jgi:MFS family permease
MALAVVLAAGFMTLLDVSIVNVALPSIERGLHAQQNALQWIVAGYALALGLLLVPAGRFGTRTAGGRCSWSAWPCSWSRARPAPWRRRRWRSC